MDECILGFQFDTDETAEQAYNDVVKKAREDEKKFSDFLNTKCDGLVIMQNIGNALPNGRINEDTTFLFEDVEYSIKSRTLAREIKITPVTGKDTINNLYGHFNDLDMLLMILEGRFYETQKIEIHNSEWNIDENEYSEEILAKKILCRRPILYCSAEYMKSYRNFSCIYKIDDNFFSSWISLKKDLDIVHQMALYNMADTKMPIDIKCAHMIEVLESLSEVVEIRDVFFQTSELKDGGNRASLRICIDKLICQYGRDVFCEEYKASKDFFLSYLVNTRVRIMHTKRNMKLSKFLSSDQSLLYLCKLSILYRIIIFNLLEIECTNFIKEIKESVKLYEGLESMDAEETILDDFIKLLKKKAESQDKNKPKSQRKQQVDGDADV